MAPEKDHNKTPLTYADAGVDIETGNAIVDAIKPLAASTRRAGADGGLGGFGGLFDLKAAGFSDPVLVAANDGVGTKLKIAIETGIHDTVGIDLVAMCVNDLVVQGAEPLFFLDYFASGKLELDVASQVIAGIAEGCRLSGAALIGGETAEMPGMYQEGDYDLAGFAVGAAERGTLLPRADLAAGDVLVGLASSGVHSNGFSLVRAILDRAGLAFADPAPFAPETTLGAQFLNPTTIYVKPLLDALRTSSGFSDPVLVAANDGVGTKLKIAIETGIHDTVGIDLVAMCVNDLVVQGAEPLFFLDYFASGKLELDVASQVIAGIAEGCRLSGAALIGGETAEMPGMYQEGDYDLAGFAVGAAERGTLLPRADLAAGDVLVGLASSGVHSNGFSLVRAILDRAGLAFADPAPFAPETTLGAQFLNPTTIYVKPLLDALRTTGGLKALAHITGGGLSENLPRVLPQHLGAVIDLGTIPPLDIFAWLAREGNIVRDEMLRTFNCGVGMVVICANDRADEVIAALTNAGSAAFRLGRLQTADNMEQVQFVGALEFLS